MCVCVCVCVFIGIRVKVKLLHIFSLYHKCGKKKKNLLHSQSCSVSSEISNSWLERGHYRFSWWEDIVEQHSISHWLECPTCDLFLLLHSLAYGVNIPQRALQVSHMFLLLWHSALWFTDMKSTSLIITSLLPCSVYAVTDADGHSSLRLFMLFPQKKRRHYTYS